MELLWALSREGQLYDRIPLSGSDAEFSLAVVELLAVRPDVNVNSKDKDGCTSLPYAAWKVYEAIAKLLLNLSDVDADSWGEDRLTPLPYAARDSIRLWPGCWWTT
jgi:hypothetical protein